MTSVARALLRVRERERQLGGDTGRMGLALVAVALTLFFELDAGGFITTDNLQSILSNSYPILMVGIVAAMLLISGNIDLSVGGMFGLLAVVASLIVRDSQSVMLAVGGTLAAGLVLGALNGVLVRYLSIGPLIVTLGTALIFRGLGYAISNGSSVFGFPAAFGELGTTRIAGVVLPIWIGLAVFVGLGVVLKRTRFGLRTYAIGGNGQAARLVGVNVGNHVTALYSLSGLAVALAAVLTVAQVGSGTADNGLNFEFDVLTAVILGGVGLGYSQGTGRPLGVFIGILTIGILDNGLVFAGVATYWQTVAKGSVLIGALAADQIAGWRRRRKITKAADRMSAAGEDAAVAAGQLEPPIPRQPIESEDRTPALRCRGLMKRFGGVFAVRDVSFSVWPGEVVCLLGDNGAGKSTVLKLVTGVEHPDEGEIEISGRRVALRGPATARALGITAVYQDLALFPNLGAAYNLIVGQEPTKLRLGPLSPIDDAAARRLADQRLGRLGARVPSLYLPVASLSGGQRQSVAIARVAGDEGSVAVLDEPTAALGVQQTLNVLRLVRALADDGTGVIMITHDIETVLAIADRVVVLRLGKVAYDGPVGAIGQSELLQLMAGFGGGGGGSTVEHAAVGNP